MSPVLGWNGGDEYESTLMLSLEGHFQTATNWCLNLPFLMAASEQAPVHRARSFDPSCIDWNDKRHAVSYIITDGDNVQWYMGGLCRAQGDSWYGHPQRGRFPFGWSCCFSQLAQLCPETLHYCVDTQTVNDTFIEWGGGYFYPDKFGLNRPDGEALLARHARRTWALMQQTGTRIIAFNVSDFDSEASLKAFETYARNMDGLLGILAFQYSPYEGGAGRVLWVKDSHDRVVPVVSARYSLWENASRRPGRYAGQGCQEIRYAGCGRCRGTPEPGLDHHTCVVLFQERARHGRGRGEHGPEGCAATGRCARLRTRRLVRGPAA